MKNSSTLPAWRQVLRAHKIPLLFLLCTFYLYFVVLFANALSIQPDGVYAGFDNVWSDWSLHIGMANIFAHKEPTQWFAYHPFYAHGQFTYGFLTNFISGMLIRFGWPLYWAFVFPSWIYSFVLVFGLYALLFQVLNSKKQALLGLSLFFLSSGPGFMKFFSDIYRTGSLRLMFPLSTNYSRVDEYQWFAGNFLNGMFIPQRAFLLGIAIALLVLNGVFYVIKNNKKSKRILIACGVLAGILPIAHMHSFIVVTIVTGLLCLVSYKRWKELAYFVVPAGLISTTLYLRFIHGGIENPEFFKWLPGWSAPENLSSWLRMWWRIWGFMLPLAVLALRQLIHKPLITKTFYVGFITVFALGNLFLFQPIHWDNSKLFLWSYLGFSALASMLIAAIWRKKLLGKVVAIVIILSLSLSGALELYRMTHFRKNSLQMTNSSDVYLALTIRRETDPQAIFLTDTSHNHWVMMWAARPILLGYTAWANNFGFLYQTTEIDLKRMFRGEPETFALLKKYDISYVVIGNGELYNQQANEAFFQNNFPVAFSNEHNRVYDVTKTLTHGQR